MKKSLKVGFLTFLVGQIAVLFYRDKNFKEKFDNAHGIDKCKILIDELFKLNKELFLDIKSINYFERFEDLKVKVNQEIEKIQEKLDEIKENYNNFNEKELQPIITELKKKVEELKNRVQDQVVSMKERYHLENKLNEILQKIKVLKENS